MEKKFDDNFLLIDTVYLHRVVALTKARQRLMRHPEIILCGSDYSVNVFTGIGALAKAAGEKLTVAERDCKDFPWELRFEYLGITFFELIEDADLTAGLPNNKDLQAFFLQ